MARDEQIPSPLEKSALILAAFPAGTALTLADVATRTGLPRSTAHRLLVSLTALGWISRNDNMFDLGMGLFELGERVPVKHRLRAAAMPFMQDLYAVTGQTVHLAVRDRNEVVYVEKLHGHTTHPLPSQIGGRLPLTCTAVGKALLATAPPEFRQQILSQPMRQYTANSITDPTALERQLAEVRRTGIALEREESALGSGCVAAPVLSNGAPIAALSVSVPIAEFRPERLAPAVRTAALALGRLMTRAR